MQPPSAYQQPQAREDEQYPSYASQQFGGRTVTQSAQPSPTQQFASQPTGPMYVGPTQPPLQHAPPQQGFQTEQPQQASHEYQSQRAELGHQPSEKHLQGRPQSATDPFDAATQPTSVHQQPIGTEAPVQQLQPESIPVQREQEGRAVPIQQQPTGAPASIGQQQFFGQPSASQEQIPWQQQPQTPPGAQGELAHAQRSATVSHQHATGQTVQQPTSGAAGTTQGGEMSVQQEVQSPSQAAAMDTLRGIPSIDILETPDEIRVFADVPGYDPDAVEVLCDDSKLTLLARRDAEEEKDATWIQRERPTEIRRELQLPAHAVVDEAEATCENGICTITLPKSEEGRQKRIGFQ